MKTIKINNKFVIRLFEKGNRLMKISTGVETKKFALDTKRQGWLRLRKLYPEMGKKTATFNLKKKELIILN